MATNRSGAFTASGVGSEGEGWWRHMTIEHCGQQLARLMVLRGVPADIEEYGPALADIPDERFTRAVDHALKTRPWFPTPADLRADVDAVAPPPSVWFEPHVEMRVGGGREVTFANPFGGKSVTISLAREWKHDCDECRDTGWRSFWCGTQRPAILADVPVHNCGRRRDHDQHECVERCACIDWNPTIRRRKEAGAKYSQAPGKVGA
jgi:hypothetical protein